MNFLEAYYTLKPIIPRRLQIAVRRQVALRKREKSREVWPIDSAAGKKPEGWPGWPEGKRFALVLTHDVETAKGVAKVRRLAELEMKLGFRSCFNFVPGDYPVPRELREFLTGNGFEIGVHGYTHKKGNLFKSEGFFHEQALGINRFLKEWGAVGFRTPCMYHDLNLIPYLEIQYDSSTFDTDPFEPQPDGVGTIFPFWVPNRNGGGLVELPSTMPQDCTLFIILKEKDTDIWKQKLDWIAGNGGLALLNIHPDYLLFDSRVPKFETYPAYFCEEFFSFISLHYENQYWQPLPKDLAKFWCEWNTNAGGRKSVPVVKGKAMTMNTTKRSPKSKNEGLIWIDLDNTPHVPFFMPIIRELKKQGYEVLLTARDCAQTCGMADLYELEYKRIGRHYGKNKLVKVAGTLFRAFQLGRKINDPKPILALSHGSRAQVIAAFGLRIPSMVIFDYEHAQVLVKPDWVMMPEVISLDSVDFNREKILTYPGIKEDVYVPDFHPDPYIKNKLLIKENELLVTIRPPANEAHYHNPESEKLFDEAVNRLGDIPDVRMVILPRNEGQKERIARTWPGLFSDGRIKFPDQVVDGLNLLWYSDLVISGGGTMNREAAALGVPVYSIFRGKPGDVDRYLAKEGRLILLETVEDVKNKLKIETRTIPETMENTNRVTLNAVVEGILKALN